MLSLLISILGFSLIVGFLLLIFTGGTLESSDLYPTLKPLFDGIIFLAQWLTFPLSWLWSQLGLPRDNVFPVTPAAPLMAVLGHAIGSIPALDHLPPMQALRSFDYAGTFTGAFYWFMPITQWLLTLIEDGIRRLQRRSGRRNTRLRNNDDLTAARHQIKAEHSGSRKP